MPPLFIITGPSGAGKSTIADRITSAPPFTLRRFVTTTTRQPRLGEVNGRDYWFVSRETFEREIANDAFFEWAEVYDNLYGSNKNEMLRLRASEEPVLVVLDVQGAKAMKKMYQDACVIFVDAPRTDLTHRMIDRKMSEAEVSRRMDRLDTEEAFRAEADVVVLNRDGELEDAIERAIDAMKEHLSHVQ